MRKLSFLFRLAIFGSAMLTFLTACGGGGATGSNSNPPVNQPEPQPQPEPEPQPEPQSSFKIEEFYPGFCSLDGNVRNTHSGYQASGYADSNNAENAAIEWKVSMASAANVSLSWHYALTSGVSEASLLVNNESAASLNFAASGGNTTWTTEGVDLDLPAGIVTLRLQANTAAGLPNIDSIEIASDQAAVVNCDGSAVAAMTPNPRCVAGATFNNEIVDCGGARIGTSCNGDDESQDPLIELRSATVRNLILAANGGADGIHCREGDCVLDNVIWEDICEDAATNKSEGGTLHITGGWAFNGSGGWGGNPDKIFQHNAKGNSTTQIDGGFTARGQNGKLWRSCGNCSNNGGPRHLIIDDVRIEGEMGSVAGLNTNYGDTVSISNLSIENYFNGNPPVCEQYEGVQSGQSSTKIGEAWDTDNCMVEPSDITSF